MNSLIKQDVEFLTSVYPTRNYRNIESLEKVAKYIETRFNEIGLKTRRQSFEFEGKSYSNIIAIIPGRKERRIILGAHYDVHDNSPGADDNASAIAGILEVANQLKQRREPKYTIEFVAFCLEEPPFFDSCLMGSYIHAESLFKSNQEVELMICLEMIGYYSDRINSQQFPSKVLSKIFPNTGNFVIVGSKVKHFFAVNRFVRKMKRGCRIKVYPVSFPLTEDYVSMSDHKSYWKFGYEAIMISDTAFFRNPNYHSNSDTADTLNYVKMQEVINGIAEGILNY